SSVTAQLDQFGIDPLEVLPAAFDGTWQGVLRRQPATRTEPVQLTLHEAEVGSLVGRWTHTVGLTTCDYRLTLTQAYGARIYTTNEIATINEYDAPPTSCNDDGYLIVRLHGTAAMTVTVYSSSDPDAIVSTVSLSPRP
ncbi:MAG: hypothetical protein L0Y54_23540, partial [Sporichthyaceae bacterium]|nr:hypothetical protein [Sporichthyaceae bacterium]